MGDYSRNIHVIMMVNGGRNDDEYTRLKTMRKMNEHVSHHCHIWKISYRRNDHGEWKYQLIFYYFKLILVWPSITH